MKFDLYADLAALKACPADGSLPAGLASGFVYGCTTVFHHAEIERSKYEAAEKSASNEARKFEARQKRRNEEARKNKARQCYMERASGAIELEEFKQLRLDADVGNLPDPSWIAFEIDFKLETPWYSKDDRLFHVLDNPVRKDRVFGVPFMSAASWKGLLRWACRMRAGLQGHLKKHGGKLEGWNDPPWILHLFGNEKEEAEHFHRGALAFRPTWFREIGFEVINPHSRSTRAGTQPIYYEVVPARACGALKLLYAPSPGAADRDKVKPAEALKQLLDAIDALLTTYGISAKRTVGWGTAKIESWRAIRPDIKPVCKESLAHFKEKVGAWLDSSGGAK